MAVSPVSAARIQSQQQARLVKQLAALLASAAVVLIGLPMGRVAATHAAPVQVIVVAQPGREAAARLDVTLAGGLVQRPLGIIDGFVATVPASAVAPLRRQADIRMLAADGRVHLLGTSFDPTADAGSAYNTTVMTGAQRYWEAGYTGRGVDVALIDSGVVGVNGLATPGKVVNGPDLSPESQHPTLAHLDTYGHGTHMAGLIAGRDSAAPAGRYAGDSSDFLGMAPDARIVSVKVADAIGETDVSQVIAALDWVVQHRHDHGLNIRVINLSFGTNSDQPYDVDPLAFAAEVAWRAGIVVVVASGNAGLKSDGLNDPAYDPSLLAVGAIDTNGSVAAAKHTVAAFTNSGENGRRSDLYAPGVHVVSLRDPGSHIDSRFGATGRVGSRFFRGSGTSQAAAIVSGAAALVIQQHPSATPDQVKQLLVNSSTAFATEDQPVSEGRGQLSLGRTLNAQAGPAEDGQGEQGDPSSGTGSLEAARGTTHIVKGGVQLTGEKDIFGMPVDTARLAALEAAQASWRGGRWNGSSWTGSSWDGSSWDTVAWSGSSWDGSSWDGSSWDGSSWGSSSWDSSSWDSSSWDVFDWS